MRCQGWTLVELMVVVALIAILVAIAVPGYSEVMQRVRREDAVNSLLALQLAQATWRHHDWDYATLAELGWSGRSQDGHYLIHLAARSSAGYRLLARPDPSGAQAGDSCGTFALDHNGPLYGPGYADAGCWRH